MPILPHNSWSEMTKDPWSRFSNIHSRQNASTTFAQQCCVLQKCLLTVILIHLFTYPLVTKPRVSTTIGMTSTFLMLHNLATIQILILSLLPSSSPTSLLLLSLTLLLAFNIDCLGWEGNRRKVTFRNTLHFELQEGTANPMFISTSFKLRKK